MKQWKWLLLLLALLLLPGCAGTETAPESAEESPPPVTDAAATPQAVPAEGLSAARTETQSRPLSEEEILSAYDRAVVAYSWFDLTPLPAGSAAAEVDGVHYRQVDYPGITDMGELQSYLRTLFSQEVVDRLLATGLYTEIDGVLYVSDGGRSRDPYIGQVAAHVRQDSDTCYFVNVSAEVLDADQITVAGVQFGAYPYALCEGRWVFTDFALPY